MSYSCPTCYNLQVLDEEDNVYDLICTNCGSVFCAKCGNESHYPALCDDFRKWNNPDLISPNDDLNCFHAMNSIKCCKETTWKYYDEVLNFLKEKESGLSPSDLYNVKGGVNYAFDELRGVISYLKWVHVHLCFNGELAPLLNNPFKYLHVQFEQLLGALPSPGVPLEDNFGVGMIKKYRLDLTLERSTFNRTLIFDRDSLKKPPPSKEERQESVQLRRVVEAQLLAHYCRP
ncbi:BnaC07g34030D [Brassica napus]|uniref:BnaC07g34030D protein n=1 Tax=Brassica napus TaxID=3708 RepID=A0A078FCA9_BRANA|nr:BnaC07g34030D [Brassica napus]